MTTSRPAGRDTGSALMGAVYSAGFYIAGALVLTVTDGVPGLGWAWPVVAGAWALTAAVLLIRRRSRTTGYGMVASVAAALAVFLVIGFLLSLLAAAP